MYSPIKKLRIQNDLLISFYLFNTRSHKRMIFDKISKETNDS